jgi:hypothetical protein
MAVLKFVKVIVKEGNTPSAYLSYVSPTGLVFDSQEFKSNRGSLYTSADDLDISRASTVKSMIMSSGYFAPPSRVTRDEWERNIQLNLKHSLVRLRAEVGDKMKAAGGRL